MKNSFSFHLSDVVGDRAVVELGPAASIEDVVINTVGRTCEIFSMKLGFGFRQVLLPWKKSGMSRFQESCQVQGASSCSKVANKFLPATRDIIQNYQRSHRNKAEESKGSEHPVILNMLSFQC